MNVVLRPGISRVLVQIAITLSAFGCRHAASNGGRSADVAAATCADVPTGAHLEHVAATANPDSLRRVLDSLDRRVASATNAELPALLLTRGRAKSAFQPALAAPAAVYAATHANEFSRDAENEVWLYTGADFGELVRRFPTSDLADDAGYASSLLPMAAMGECEDFSCTIGHEWPFLSYFLNAFPASPLADSAADRALALFLPYDSIVDPREKNDYYDPGEFRSLVASLDTTGRVMRRPARVRVLARAGELWDRAGDYARAASAYRAALVGADSNAAKCIAAHLATIPTHPFSLAPTLTLNTRRVDLHWDRVSVGNDGFRVFRSPTRTAMGSEIGRAQGVAQSWTDTTVRPGTTYWYRVVGVGPSGDTLQSNASPARVPTAGVSVFRAAVSTADHSLYLFGSLSNTYPQALRISADGARVEHLEGVQVGSGEYGLRAHRFDAYVDDLWFAGANGRGVLHFRKNGRELPTDMFGHIRYGADLIRGEFAREFGRAFDAQVDGMDELLVAVDERAGAMWIDHYGGGGSPIATGCIGAQSLCWIEYETKMVLRNDAGAIIASVGIPHGHNHSGRAADGVYLDPRDSSTWIAMCSGEHASDATCEDVPAHLMHVVARGTPRRDIKLADHDQASSVSLSADPDAGIIWLKRTTPGHQSELCQIDLRSADPQPRVIATGLKGAILADLAGGVWLLNDDSVQRIDGNGRSLFTVSLADK